MPRIEKQALLKTLPYLRRYARALTGCQKSADAAVLATVQLLAVSGKDPSKSQNIALYQAFTQIWGGPIGLQIRALSTGTDGRSAVDQKLATLPSQARQAFLLSVVEGFNDSQIAEILNLTERDIPAIKTAARVGIARTVTTDILIIEDEMFIATDLQEIMVALGHTVISIERTHTAAVNAIRKRRPGLVLADIHLADGSSGLDAVNDILAMCEVPVVFITANPERLLTGQRPEPAFILSKPFKPETVAAIVSQALFFESKAKRASPAKPAAETARIGR